MRASRYNEIVKIDDQRYFLFNTITCATDIVNSEVLKWLKTLPQSEAERQELSPSAADLLDRFVARGYVTERSTSEEVAAVRERFEALRPQYLARRLHALVVTYDCNMRCTYCFEQDLQHRDEQGVTLPALTRDMVDRILELIVAYDGQFELDHPYPIFLYGGEPLMLENYELVEYILERGDALGYSFVIFTNGFDLIDFTPMLNRYPDTNIHVTLDGTQDVHNALRPSLDGGPTFKRIVQGIEAVRAAGIRVTLRINVDAHTARFLPQFWDFLQSKGWDRDRSITLLLSEIRHSAGCSPCSQQTWQVAPPERAARSRSAWQERPSRASLFKANILSHILRGQKPTRFPRYWFCDAHCGLRLYDPNGNIYLCWSLVGKEKARVGRYWPVVTPRDKAVCDRWSHRHVLALKRCSRCKYLLLCGGGCAVEALSTKGDLMEPICWDFQGFLQDYIPSYFRREAAEVPLRGPGQQAS